MAPAADRDRRRTARARYGSRFACCVPVLCQIDCRREEARLVVHLAGRLCASQVPELLAACADSALPILELDELISADAAGFDALLRLEQLGARLKGLPEYPRGRIATLSRDARR